MAISFIGHAAAAATSVATTNAVGDLLLVCAFRSGSATPPTLPGTYTAVLTAPANGGGGTNNSAQVGWRIATATNEGSGTWTNATAVEVLVLRGTHATAPIGGSAEDSANATTTTIIYPAVTLTDASGGSWVAAFGMRTTTGAIAAVATAPTGFTNRGSTPATPYLAAHTLGPTSSNFAGETVTVGGTSVKPIAVVLEVLAPAVLAKAGTDGAKAADSATAVVTQAVSATDGAKACDTATRALTFNSTSIRQAIINGITSAQSETHGWNAERVNIPVSAVVRTSDTVVTITLPALTAYDITALETLTATVPGAALSSGSPIVATPTMDVASAAGGLSKAGTDGAKVTDSATVTHTTAKAGTDGATAADTGTAPRTRLGVGTDGAKAADTGTAVETRVGVGTDGVKAADTGTAARSRLGPGTDGVKVTDTATGTFPPLVKSATDGAKAADTATGIRTRTGVGTDGAKAADAGTVTHATAKSGTDGAKATDSATGLRLYVRSATDGVKAADTPVAPRSRLGIGTDGAKAADSPVGIWAGLRVITEGSKATDAAIAALVPSFEPVGRIQFGEEIELRVPDLANTSFRVPEEALLET